MAKRGRRPKEIQIDETLGGTPQTPTGDKTGGGKLPRLLPLKSDLIFKLVFGDSRYIAIIRAFLIAVLDIPAEEYESLEI
ncbi:MAG: hypothetical protein LBI74_01435, partial [Synergistaceae bacterium]|nr:hypothetical protein [Synergistaceae bacterium]